MKDRVAVGWGYRPNPGARALNQLSDQVVGAFSFPDVTPIGTFAEVQVQGISHVYSAELEQKLARSESEIRKSLSDGVTHVVFLGEMSDCTHNEALRMQQLLREDSSLKPSQAFYKAVNFQPDFFGPSFLKSEWEMVDRLYGEFRERFHPMVEGRETTDGTGVKTLNELLDLEHKTAGVLEGEVLVDAVKSKRMSIAEATRQFRDRARLMQVTNHLREQDMVNQLSDVITEIGVDTPVVGVILTGLGHSLNLVDGFSRRRFKTDFIEISALTTSYPLTDLLRTLDTEGDMQDDDIRWTQVFIAQAIYRDSHLKKTIFSGDTSDASYKRIVDLLRTRFSTIEQIAAFEKSVSDIGWTAAAIDLFDPEIAQREQQELETWGVAYTIFGTKHIENEELLSALHKGEHGKFLRLSLRFPNGAARSVMVFDSGWTDHRAMLYHATILLTRTFPRVDSVDVEDGGAYALRRKDEDEYTFHVGGYTHSLEETVTWQERDFSERIIAKALSTAGRITPIEDHGITDDMWLLHLMRG